MISSVIVKLNSDRSKSKQTISEIDSHPSIEIGELIDGRMLPLTIETNSNRKTEDVTRWLMSVDGVAFVDVVFAHFEEGDTIEPPNRRRAAPSAKNPRTKN